MVSFRIARLDDASVFTLFLERDEIWLDPPYQRYSEIWPLEKRQLLIDSLLNGFDIPKFYFHDFYPGRTIKGEDYRFAIIDGKQRLDAIWKFIEGKFPLSKDIELINDPSIDLRGLTYSELGEQHPRLKSVFDSRGLSVVTIQTDEEELIEEMFSRLNEAVPLSAAEKRNALRGPIPPVIRKLATHDFFKNNVPFGNSRYRHFDLACKFLLLVDEAEIVDVKKAYLDSFVIEFREEKKDADAKRLDGKVVRILNRMNKAFTDGDELLRSISNLTLYFCVFAGIEDGDLWKSVSRSSLARFEKKRAENRRIAEQDVRKASYDLLEFDRWAQSPNDAVALRYRYGVLRDWLVKQAK
jgi:hypothetical protein